jgi:hypothetical protein
MGLTRSSAYKCVRPISGMALKFVAAKPCPQLEDHDTLSKGGGAMCMKPRRDCRTPEDFNLQSQRAQITRIGCRLPWRCYLQHAWGSKRDRAGAGESARLAKDSYAYALPLLSHTITASAFVPLCSHEATAFSDSSRLGGVRACVDKRPSGRPSWICTATDPHALIGELTRQVSSRRTPVRALHAPPNHSLQIPEDD